MSKFFCLHEIQSAILEWQKKIQNLNVLIGYKLYDAQSCCQQRHYGLGIRTTPKLTGSDRFISTGTDRDVSGHLVV